MREAGLSCFVALPPLLLSTAPPPPHYPSLLLRMWFSQPRTSHGDGVAGACGRVLTSSKLAGGLLERERVRERDTRRADWRFSHDKTIICLPPSLCCNLSGGGGVCSLYVCLSFSRSLSFPLPVLHTHSLTRTCMYTLFFLFYCSQESYKSKMKKCGFEPNESHLM